MPDRPVAGQLEDRALPLEVDGRRIRGVIPYGVESHDLGGFREVIDRGALDGASLDELVAVVEHAGVPIGRHPRTLELEDRNDGMHWAVEPPHSRQDVVEAVERGDLRSGSWRMRVARERWDGDTRHITAIAELRHVALVAAPAYPTAAVELRSQPSQEPVMPDLPITPPAPAAEPQATPTSPAPAAVAAPPAPALAPVEDRNAPEGPGLPVESRNVSSGRAQGLTDRFRAAGFPGERAVLPWQDYEDRALVWSGSVDGINRHPAPAAAGLGYDQRWIWPLFARVGVEEGVTSVDVPTQSARTLATPANMVRAVDAVTAKPENATTVQIVSTALKQVAVKTSGIPNVYLESSALATIVNDDLTLALNDALDSLVLAAIASAGFSPLGTDNPYVAYRKAVTVMRAAGYNPDLLILTPAADEALDIMVSGVSGGTADFVNAPGQGGPDAVFRMARRVSKTIPAPAIVDTRALGKYYASPVSLAKFEENAGATNTSLVRLETHAVFGLERQPAAIRIAAA